MTTEKRSLGKSGARVSPMGLGCWAIGGAFWSGKNAIGWGTVNDDESIRSIRTALERGVTFFDTADVYGTGHSERILARGLGSGRKDVVIATKFGNTFDEAARQATGFDASPEYIRRACEASLNRLDTDYIDLYQFHLNGFDLEGAGAVRDTLEALREEGKIRWYGWSTDFPDRARFFAEGSGCTAVQHQENVLDDNAPMIGLCEDVNLASINRGPLAMGLLTGKYTPDSRLARDDVRGDNSPDWMKYFKGGRPNPEWLEKLDAVREILTSNGRTLAQGALAWLWARSEKTIPIPGFRTAGQVEENIGAIEKGPLLPGQMKEIEALLGRTGGR
ncbi:MAG: aldo/keto reductase [Spirochaetales bacterium]|nr:aldo/keto reductase [Spirochaetales bacterium]